MKKYLFKQTKKAFSLFLAVVMLMSCWVWFAPEEAKVAQAVDAAKTGYTVTVNYNIANQDFSAMSFYYKHVGTGWNESDNGSHLSVSPSEETLKKGNHSVTFSTGDNFPTVVYMKFTGPGSSGCGDSKIEASVITIQTILINGKQVYVAGDNVLYTMAGGEKTFEVYPTLDGNGYGSSGNMAGTYTWNRPYVAGFVNSSAQSGDANDQDKNPNAAISLNVNKLGGSSVFGSTSFNMNSYTCVDQYEKQLSDDLRNTLISANRVFSSTTTPYVSNSPSGSQTQDVGISASGDTVTVSPELQANNGKSEYYLVKEYVTSDGTGGEVRSKASARVKLTYPTYKVLFNAKGTVNDAQFAPKIKVGDTTYTNEYPVTGLYNSAVTIPDDKNVTAEGYTFYGFWSEKQPTSGDAWFYSKTADFAKPISSETFTENIGKGGKVSDSNPKLMTYDADGDGTEEKYYNAGTQYTDQKMLGDATVYGWWCSNDYTVKFYDVDGKFIDTFAVKYGQTADAIKSQYGGVLPESAYADTGFTSGAFTYKVSDTVWVDGNGVDITLSSHRFTEDLVLTPKLTRDGFKDDYAVKFTDPADGSAISVGTQGGAYNYRQNIKAEADEAAALVPATLTTENILTKTDLQYRYEFVGWTDVAPSGKNYHILLEDANFDEDGNAVSLNNDWIVRDEATYYAVYRRFTKSYNVSFTYKNTTGAETVKNFTVKYGDKLVPPSDAPYEYNVRGNKYTFANWRYTKDQAGNKATFGKNATLDFTSENILIFNGALEGGSGVIAIEAVYGDPVATPFKVGFTYPDDKGEDVVKSANVLVDTTMADAFVENAAGNNVSFVIADELKPAAEFDDGAAVYKFANSWKIVSGAGTIGLNGAAVAAGAEVSADNLINFVPTSDVEFEAVYSNPVSYHNVTYIDGEKSFVGKALFGTDLPRWTEKVTNDGGTPDDTSDDTVEDELYVPADYKGNGGTYVFQGWFDAKQTDETYDKTNGKPITDYATVPGDITFYSQFIFVPDTFSIEFKNYDGSENIVWGEFQYGWSIEGLTAQANKGAQNSREDDPVYDYIFIGWDKTVPTFCEGKDMEFIAQYKAVYKYYDAKWYNSTAIKDADGNITGWTADKSTHEDEDGNDVETNLLATSKHTYDSKLYTPSVDAFACPETAPAGQNFVFAGWCYDIKDENGNVTGTGSYSRGMKITEDMEFYATYALSAKTYTVTTVVDGQKTEYTVASGKKVTIPDPQDGYVDATYHNEFLGWYTDAAFGTEFDADEEITADVTVYAKFDKSEHQFTNKQVKTNPTYYADGVNEVWCSCDATRRHEEAIPKLVDNVKPTGTIYLGDLGKWSSTDAQGAATDDNEVTLRANADTDVIITANDTGAYDALYNPSSVGIGVKLIRAFVYPGETPLTAEGYGAAQQVAIDVYKNETQALTNNANFAIKLGDAYVADLDAAGKAQYNDDGTLKTKSLQSGEVYIVYYYVVDKAGNQLSTKVRTAKFIYDNTDPVFGLEGFHNDAAVPTYCGTVKVTGIEEGTTLTVNGKAVAVAADGTYVISYAEGVDNVIITAEDEAHNTYTKKIKVSDHNYHETEVPSDCLNDGYKESECTICGDKTEREEYPSTGHVMGQPAITPADCFNNGYVTVKCENCDYEIKTEFEADGVTPILPKLDHVYEMDGEEIKYTTVTASTCKTKGKAEAVCTACGEGKLEKELDLDPTNHEKIDVAEAKATCTLDGYYTETCICGEVVKSETYPATGHGNVEEGTAEWYIKTENSCCQDGEEALKCFKCTLDIDSKVIPTDKALHVFYIADMENDVQRPDIGVEGQIKWTCKVCGETKIEKRGEALEGYNVTFVTDDGETAFTDLVAGTMIGKDQVAEPTKAATEKYTYKFAGWVEVITNEDGSTTDGATYKLPLTVTKGMTLKATFRATPILYTHSFYVPNVWVSPLEGMTGYDEYAVLVGTHGDELKPSSEPVFKLADAEADAELKKMYTFKFKGWKDVLGNVVTDFSVTESTKFYAYFEAIPVTYTVTYLNGTDYVWSTTVNGGEAVVYNNKNDKGEIINPEKAFDDTYHYEFAKWYTEAALKTEYKGEAITSKTQLYAGFTAVEHSGYVVDTTAGVNKDGVVQKATCTLPELTQYICSCGHTKLVETAEALNHKDADGNSTIKTETVEKEDGIYNITKCTVCDEVISETKTSYTIVFKNWNGITLQTSVLNAGADIKFEKEVPAKAEDEKHTYTFAGWCVAGDETETIVTLGKATEDVVYVAVFEEIAKTFRVTFVDKDNNPITTKDGVAYGTKLVAGDFPADQDNYFTKNDHYTFIGWSASVGDEIKSDLLVKPVFEVEGHEWYNTGLTTGATCDEAGGEIWKCRHCDAQENRDGAKPLGHKWVELEGSRVEPDLENEIDGYYYEKCSVCGTVSEKIIIEVAKKRDVVITVKDSNGNAIHGALVELYKDGNRIDAGDTNANGVITFKAYEGKYTVLVSKVEDAENVSFNINVGKDGYSGEAIMQIAEATCGCSCHRNGFWGIVFRFFHKIISFFTGKISCCSDPSSAY